MRHCLAANVKRLRKDRGWTQEFLAKVAGLERLAVTRIENKGRENCHADTLISLAGALGVTLDELVHGHRRARKAGAR